MSVSTEQLLPFVEVIECEFAKCYILSYVTNGTDAYVSQSPKFDLKTAQAAAKTFACQNQILYSRSLIKQTKPIITLLRKGKTYYTAQLCVDKINILSKGVKFQKNAESEAAFTAKFSGLPYHPSLGLSLVWSFDKNNQIFVDSQLSKGMKRKAE